MRDQVSSSLSLAAWSLKLAAWGLQLVARSFLRLELEACSLGPVAILPGPLFVNLVYDIGALSGATVVGPSVSDM